MKCFALQKKMMMARRLFTQSAASPPRGKILPSPVVGKLRCERGREEISFASSWEKEAGGVVVVVVHIVGSCCGCSASKGGWYRYW